MHFIGSKHSIWPWIRDNIDLKYSTVVDLFGGTGVVSQGFRLLDKRVYYNDFLIHLQIIASGLLLSDATHCISDETVTNVLNISNVKLNHHYIKDNFSDIYFFSEEAEWIDQVYYNIQSSSFSQIQKNILFFALVQAILKKRPFHTFHGSFLNLRLKERQEKQTWDLTMNQTFRDTIHSVNMYLQNLPTFPYSVSISGYMASQAKPDLFTAESIDLLYLDPPFISDKKKRTLKFANYIKNYSVLELLANYDSICSLFDDTTKTIIKNKYPASQEMDLWIDQNQKNWLRSFETIVKNFQDSAIIVSYRADSLITCVQIKGILESYKKVNVKETPHIYEIPGKKSKFNDLLFIAK